MILSALLPRRLFHACHVELWGRDLDREPPAAPSLPPGLAVACVTDREPAGSPRRRGLAAAMAPTPEPEIDARLASGRRAYVVEGPPGILAYGWVTRGDEEIAEVEGRIRVGPSEAYIWDCATLPAYRGRGLYPALLGAIARDLAGSGVTRVWIAARADNAPSLRGLEKAGFERVADIRYVRLWRWRRLAVRRRTGQPPPSVLPLPLRAVA
ncbi:MAG TPA: GNAT family N-acetyltransferase [Thermodesulfobacteriota bacterium]